MKEMIYVPDRIQPERIAEGEYKGLKYYVLSLGTHPCAYVDVSETNLCGCDYSNIDIECHCGLTYSDSTLATVEKEGWYIGWDYAHYCDYAGYEIKFPFELRSNGKKWTTTEIVNECKEVIDQILKIQFGCEFKPHCTDDCESCEYAKAVKQQQELEEAVQVANAVICKAFEPVLYAIDKVIKKIVERKTDNEKN